MILKEIVLAPDELSFTWNATHDEIQKISDLHRMRKRIVLVIKEQSDDTIIGEAQSG